jgi:hypothetical protein
MKYFLFKSFPYLIIFLLIGFVRLYISFDERYNYFNYKTKNISKKIVIIGDSKSLVDFDDDFFEENSMINFSTWGAKPLNHLNALKGYKLENNLIFLVVSSRIFVSNDSLKIGNDIQSIFNFNLYDKAKDYYFHADQGNWEYYFQKNGSIKMQNLYRGYRPFNRNGDSTFYSKLIRDPGRIKFTQRKIEHFLVLYNNLKLNNRVVLIDLPERFSYYNYAKRFEVQLFNEIKKPTGEEIIDFGVLPDFYFYDSHHLNRIGSRVFTKNFVEFLNKQKLEWQRIKWRM